MRIYGFFRGFPGLGRVVSGISILSMLKDMGHEIKAYSYLQGVQALKEHSIDFLLEKQPTKNQVMAIGINPICEVAGEIISKICRDKPDMVIVDGEPLFISTLAMVYPRRKIISLLNPADLYNPALPVSTIKFYHSHYLAAGSAIVHGVDRDSIVLPDEDHKCEILRTNTILRRDIIDAKLSEGKEIVSILGGGSSNSSDNFWDSTITMGKQVIDAAKYLHSEQFVIYCNDSRVEAKLSEYMNSDNVRIVSEYTLPHVMYSTAKIVISRAGRNTISEILYLKLPAILMSSCGDFRSSEQEKNIDQACAFRGGRFLKLENREDGKALVEKIKTAIAAADNGLLFVPGNKDAIDFVLNKAEN